MDKEQNIYGISKTKISRPVNDSFFTLDERKQQFYCSKVEHESGSLTID